MRILPVQQRCVSTTDNAATEIQKRHTSAFVLGKIGGARRPRENRSVVAAIEVQTGLRHYVIERYITYRRRLLPCVDAIPPLFVGRNFAAFPVLCMSKAPTRPFSKRSFKENGGARRSWSTASVVSLSQAPADPRSLARQARSEGAIRAAEAIRRHFTSAHDAGTFRGPLSVPVFSTSLGRNIERVGPGPASRRPSIIATGGFARTAEPICDARALSVAEPQHRTSLQIRIVSRPTYVRKLPEQGLLLRGQQRVAAAARDRASFLEPPPHLTNDAPRAYARSPRPEGRNVMGFR
ncbi:hypothetical protein QO001_005632 [Methylobacterium brachiatum]|uniref:Uncharacterized protein n=1 Tax=Methylobacterium brachiatum TaxID=269660 RepID=A0AAJ1TTP6_9HYPH|nr:hypothetical protein [Methylobacterium brachiatum]